MTQADAGSGSTVISLSDRAIRMHPEAAAVIDGHGPLTFGELGARADHLAAALQASGVRTGQLVAQCVERSAALVVAELAVLRAGGAFVAIDPRYPPERIGWMLEDAGVAAVIADSETAPGLNANVPQLVLGPGGALFDTTNAADVTAERREPDPRDIAYAVYTSGSTGQPKGVLVDHAALANLVRWHLRAFALTAGDRTTQIASPGFDASIWEVWPALAAGATLLVVPDQLRTDPARLRDWLLAQEVAVSFVPTAVTERLLELPWPATAPLRHLLTGGDALGRRPRPGLPFTLVNNYGLSETAVVATSGAVTPDGPAPPSIGRPIDGMEAEVVDERLEPVADGTPGELVLGGDSLARGYLGRAELTAERFLETSRGRRYRTGDRVRRRANGEIDFLGRVDDQLSIRGFRVEPSEISHALGRHPSVRASAVTAAGETSAGRRLVAYVVPADAGTPDAAELAAHLSATLPEYMVPSQWVWLRELPLTAHGKVDRSALPAPDGGSAGVHGLSTPATAAIGGRARTATEEAVAAIVAELLGVEEVGVEDNFFLIGGHSMLGAQLIVRLEERFGVEISLRGLFDHPTSAEIAAEIDNGLACDPATTALAG